MNELSKRRFKNLRNSGSAMEGGCPRFLSFHMSTIDIFFFTLADKSVHQLRCRVHHI